MQPNENIQKYEGKGAIIPFEYFEALAAYYFGGKRNSDGTKLKPSGATIAVDSALFGKMLQAWYGKGETHPEEFPAPEIEEGVGKTEETSAVREYDPDPRIFVPGGRLAQKIMSGAQEKQAKQREKDLVVTNGN